MKIEIKRFKKHHDLTVAFPATVSGENGSGKTTILDAFLWCMNQRSIDMKEFTSSNVYNHEDRDGNRFAEVAFHTDDMIFRKAAKPLYSRERGTDDEKLKTELNCEYFLNETPVKLADYNAAIADTCKGYDLALFTNPQYFISLAQKDKLKIISSIVNVNLIDYIRELPNKAVLRKEINEQKAEMEELNIKSKSLRETFAEKPKTDRNTARISALQKEIEQMYEEERAAVSSDVLAENQSLREKIQDIHGEKFTPKPQLVFTPAEIEAPKMYLELKKNPEIERLLVTYRGKVAEREAIDEKIAYWNKQRETVASVTSAAADKEDFICMVCPYCTNADCAEIQRNTSKADAALKIAAKLEEIDKSVQNLEERKAAIVAEIDAVTKQGSELRNLDKTFNESIELQNEAIKKENEEIAARNAAINETNAKAREQFSHDNQVINDENAANLCKWEDDKAKRIAELQAKIITDFKGVNNSEKIQAAKLEIEQLQSEDKKADEIAYGYATADEQIAKNDARSEMVRKALIENERQMIAIEQAENDYRTDCQDAISKFLPDGIEITLFRKLITQEGFEEVAIMKIDGFENPNTSRANAKLSMLCQRFQDHFAVALPIFFDNAENCEKKNMPLLPCLVELRVKENSPLIIES